MRKSLMAAAIAAASCVPASAIAAPYPAIYVFGDSLFDTGQFGGQRFTNRVGPDFRNSQFGPVSPDLVAQGLGLERATPSRDGGTNYAVGGNRSADTLASITAQTTYEGSAGIARPGLNVTFNSLFYNLERRRREFDRNAIYLLDGGGNDIGAGQVFDQATAGVVATNMVSAATALRERGARYVVVANVPDFGLVPAGIALGDFATAQAASINEQIRAQLGAANVLVFDAFGMLREIAAAPAAYGVPLSSAQFSLSCFDSDAPTCAQGNAAAKIDGADPDPGQFMFNDPLHPTTIGQQLIADHLLALLRAPGEIALLPEMGLDDMRAHWRATQPVLRSNRWAQGTPVGAYTVWGGLNGQQRERDTAYGDTGESDATQYNLGLNYRISSAWYLGGMLSRAENTLDFDHSRSSYDMQSLSLSLLSGFRSGPVAVEGVITYADLDYDDLQRTFDLGPLLRRTEHGDTGGDALGVLINVAYNVVDVNSGARFGPMVGYQYVRAEVDGYREGGGRSTALTVADQDVTTDIWSAGLFGQLALGMCACELYSEAVYQAYEGDSGSNPRIGLVSVPGNSATLPGYERDDDGWRWDVGLAARLTPALELNIGAGIDDSGDAEGVWYGGELSYSF